MQLYLEVVISLMRLWSVDRLVIISTEDTQSDELFEALYEMSRLNMDFNYLEGPETRNILYEELIKQPEEKMIVYIYDTPKIALDIINGTISRHVIWIFPGQPDAHEPVSFPALRLDSQIYSMASIGDTQSVEITEHYGIRSKDGNGTNLIERPIGSWNNLIGLNINRPILEERRSDFMGLPIIATYIEFKPFLIVLNGNGTSAVDVTGFHGDMIKILAQELNFSLVYEPSRDGRWGGKQPDGEFNGMVGMLMDGVADVCISALSVTLEREEVMDFTYPTERDVDTMSVRVPSGTAMNFWAYVDVFMFESWVLAIVVSTCMAAVFASIRYYTHDTFHERKDPESFGFLNALAVVYLAFLQLEYPLNKTSPASKVLLLSICFSMYLIFAFFNAVLTSLMASGPPPLAINSMQDILDSDYNVIVLKASSNEEAMKASPRHSPLYRIYKSLVEDDPDSYVNSVQEAGERLLDDPKLLYFGASVSFSDEEEIMSLPLQDALFGYFAFGLAPNSQFTPFFRYHLLKMDQSGIRDRLVTEWISGSSSSSSAMVSEVQELGYDNVLFPFLVLLFGSAGALGVMCFETLARVLLKPRHVQ